MKHMASWVIQKHWNSHLHLTFDLPALPLSNDTVQYWLVHLSSHIHTCFDELSFVKIVIKECSRKRNREKEHERERKEEKENKKYDKIDGYHMTICSIILVVLRQA